MSSARLQDARSMYKNLWYFHTLEMNNPKNKIKRTIPLKIASKRVTYLGVNLAKNVQHLLSQILTEISNIERN